jgi:hypothetical protein
MRHRESPGVVTLQMAGRMTQDNAPIALKKSSPKHSYWGIASLAISILLAVEVAGVTSLLPEVGTLRLPAFVAANIGPWSIQALFVSLLLAIVGLVREQRKIYSILSLIILVMVMAMVAVIILGLAQLIF